MYITIDRFENDSAIVETENREIYRIPSAIIPGACEGDVISIFIDASQTKKQKDEVETLMNELFKD